MKLVFAAGSGDILVTLTVTDKDGEFDTDVSLFVTGNDAVNDVITITDTTVTINAANTSIPGGIDRVVVLALGGDDIIDASASTRPVVLDGGAGSNLLTGGSSHDVLIGGSGDDTLRGGPGNDLFFGRHGDDLMEGGSGNDRFFLVPGSDITVTEAGASGIDELNFSLVTNAVGIQFDLGVSGQQTVDGVNTVTTFGSFETLVGTRFGDQLSASTGSGLTIFGGEGGDELSVVGASVSGITIFGGENNDSVTISAGTNITIFGGEGGDAISVTSAAATGITIFGGESADLVTVSAGSGITIFGGEEGDTLNVTGAAATGITIFGGENGDSIGVAAGSNITIFGGEQADLVSVTGGTGITIYGGAEADVAQVLGGDSITIFGGENSDTVSLTAGTNIIIFGGEDQDAIQVTGTAATGITIFGGESADLVTVSAGSGITIFGGQDADTLNVNGAAATGITIFGGESADLVTVSAGSGITIFGGEDADTLNVTGSLASGITIFGGEAGDGIGVAAGSQIIIFGGESADVLSVSGGDSITIFGGESADVASITGGDSIAIFGGESSDSFGIEAGSHIIIFGGEADDSVSVSGGNLVSIYGGEGNDVASVTAGTNIAIFGDENNDQVMVGGTASAITIFGGESSDTVTVAAGANIIIYGGEASDSVAVTAGTGIIIYGGEGADQTQVVGGSLITIFGGEGADASSVSGGSLIAIYGGEQGDLVSVSGGSGIVIFGGEANDVVSVTAGTGIIIFGGENNDSISVTGNLASQITIYGDEGNDTLTLSAGTRISIFGGQDADQVSISGSASQIAIFGGDQADVASVSGSASNVIIFGGEDSDLASVSGSASNIVIYGGENADTAQVLGGSLITIFGGEAGDLSSVSAGSHIVIYGGEGGDVASISGGSLVTIFGGEGADLGTVSGGSLIAIYGDAGDDSTTITDGVNVGLFGNQGADVFGVAGGSQIGVFGGTESDTVNVSAGAHIIIYGDEQEDTCHVTGGSDVTIFGGEANDTASVTGGALIAIYGGEGRDALSVLAGLGVVLAGEGGNDTVQGFGGDNLLLLGGPNSDLLIARGGTNVSILGEDGDDSYDLVAGSGSLNLSVRETKLVGTQAATIELLANGTDTLQFSAIVVSGTTGISIDLAVVGSQNIGYNLTLALSGEFENIVGTAGNDVLRGNERNNFLQGGGGDDQLFGLAGNDKLEGGAGNDLLDGGAGNDSYTFAGMGLGSDTIVEAPNADTDTVDLTTLGAAAVIDLSNSATQVVSSGNLSLTLQDSTAIENLLGTAFNDVLTGNPRSNTLTGNGGDDILNGGAADDRYIFAGASLGSDTVIEAANADTDTLDFSAFLAPVSIDLSVTTPQVLSSGNLTLTLSDGLGIENVIGGPFADHIAGNARNNQLFGAGGADVLDGRDGDDLVQGGITQTVFLNFDTATEANEHVYTTSERDQIQQRLEEIYSQFSVVFTQVLPAVGDFARVIFNAEPTGGVPTAFQHGAGCSCPFCRAARAAAGGLASELDFLNLSRGGTAVLDVNGFLPQVFTPTDTSADQTAKTIALTANVAAHEVGHLLGLRHADAFGPFGSGPQLPPGVNYYPALPESVTAQATESRYHIMASPASLGTSLLDSTGTLFLGEREALKLAYEDTGAAVSEQAVAHADSVTAQMLGILPAFHVPNTIQDGHPFAGVNFQMAAISVLGGISSAGERDVYSFVVHAGDILNFEVSSGTLSRIADPIDSVLRVWRLDANGVPVQVLYNDDEFELRDSSIVDALVTADGVYFAEVSAFSPSDIGSYNLFISQWAAPLTSGVDISQADMLVASHGQDTLIGSSGHDLFVFSGDFGTDFATVIGAAGTDLLDLTNSTNAVVQTPSVSGNIIALGIETIRASVLANAIPILDALNNHAVSEGALVLFSAQAHDANLPYDQLTFSLAPLSGQAYPAGAVINAATGEFAWSATETGDYGVQVVVTDRAGASAARPVLFQVTNVAPIASLSFASATVNEGSPLVVTGSFTDPGQNPWTATVDYGDGDGVQALALNADKSFSLQHAYADNGVFNVVVTIQDHHGGVSTVTLPVHVENVAPTAAFANNGPVDEAAPVTVSFGSQFDPSSADTAAGFRYSFALTPGGLVAGYSAVGTTASAGFTFADNGSYTVWGRIFDRDGGFRDYTTTVVVHDVAPTATLANNGPADEPATLTVTFSNQFDPSPIDTAAGFHYSFALASGDLAGTYAAAGSGSSAPFNFADSGSYTVYGRIFDKDGGFTTYTTTVMVNNLAPTASISNNGPVNEGNPVTVSLSGGTDVSSADITAGFRYSFATNASDLAGTYGAAGASTSAPFTFADNGSYTVYGRIFDKDGGYSDYATTVTVNNVAPSLGVIGGPSSGVPGQLLTYGASFTDPGILDTHTLSIGWGDGNTTAGTVNETNGSGTGSGSHAYSNAGAFTITFMLTDKDGGVGTATRTNAVTVSWNIVILNTTAQGALALSGNASIIAAGEVVIDSNNSKALKLSGNAHLTAPAISVVGGKEVTGNAVITGPVTTGATVLLDPLAALIPPSPTGMTNYGAVNETSGSRTLSPGLYSSIKASGNDTLTLNPGVYIIAGGGLSVSGNASVTGNGVVIYNAGSNVVADTGTFGGIAISGNGNVQLTAPTGGPFTGVVIFQSRNNTRAVDFSGNAVAGLTGTIYAPRALLTLSGNTAISHAAYLVNTLTASGNGASSLVIDAADGADHSVGQLLGADICLYIDNVCNGGFTDAQNARLLDAVARIDTLLADYGVTMTVVGAADKDLANFTISYANTTDNGGAPEGVLGSTKTSGEITLVQGWDWFAGADASAIQPGQYDFQTVVTHELGHALGLGHRADSSSVMYPTLEPTDARRVLTAADLAVPDLEQQVYAHPLLAAPYIRGMAPAAAAARAPPQRFRPPPWTHSRFNKSCSNTRPGPQARLTR